jgi:integrase
MIKTNIAEHIDGMIATRVALGYSPRTYETFKRDFARFAEAKDPEAMSLREELVLDWACIRDGEKPTGHAARIAKVRLLGQYMSAMGVEAYVLPTGMSSRKTDFRPYIFSDGELRSLFSAADNIEENKSMPLRHLELPMLLRLLYYCGLRPGEGRCLELADLNLDSDILTVKHNKMRKPRTIPIAESLADMLGEYMRKLDSLAPESTFVFPGMDGTPRSSRWLKINFRQLWLKAFPSSDAPVRAYDLRHRYASMTLMKWVEEGVNINARLPYLSAYMGHENLSDTAYYIHLLPENLIRSANLDWAHFEALLPEVSL